MGIFKKKVQAKIVKKLEAPAFIYTHSVLEATQSTHEEGTFVSVVCSYQQKAPMRVLRARFLRCPLCLQLNPIKVGA